MKKFFITIFLAIQLVCTVNGIYTCAAACTAVCTSHLYYVPQLIPPCFLLCFGSHGVQSPNPAVTMPSCWPGVP